MASTHRLLSKTSPNIIFLQETLVVVDKERLFMNRIIHDWMIYVVSSMGTSGGLLESRDPIFFALDPYLRSGGIFLLGTPLMDNKNITLLNVYRPYQDCKDF
jgi:hypothetical protein